MSTTIPVAYVRKYADEVIQKLNQQGSLLSNTVLKEPLQGASHDFDLIDQPGVSSNPARNSDTEYYDMPISGRRVSAIKNDTAALITQEDKVKTLWNPDNAYARAQAAALGVKTDKMIIEALGGSANNVDTSGNTSISTFPASQVVGEDEGTANSGMNIAKLLAANQIFQGHTGTYLGGKITMVVDATMMRSLLEDSTIQNIDTNIVRPLVTGQVREYVGMTFIVVRNGLLPGTGTEADPVMAYAYMQDAVGMATSMGLTVRIEELAHKRYATQVYSANMLGVTRIQDEGVVAIECVQS